MDMRRLLNLIKLSFKEWSEDRAPILGAALAYYTIFSIGPLLVTVIGILGLVLGPDAASGKIAETLEGTLGESGAETVQGIIAGASKPAEGIVATVIGLVGVLLGALGIFGQLKNALNIIWEAPKKKSGGIVQAVLSNVAMFALVVVSALVLLLSLAATAVISSIEKIVGPVIPGGPLVWQLLNFVMSLGLVTLMFAMIFRALPDVKIAWKDVWLGSFITALLFMAGQVLIGFYLAVANVGSAFGAAGSLVAILVYIYYSAQIVFLGAEITQVYANMYGSHVGEKEEWALRLPFRDRKSQEAQEQKKARQARSSPWFGERGEREG